MINTLIRAVNLLFRFLEYAIFIDVILSWVYRGKGNVFIDILHIFTDPFMGPARKLQQRFTSMSMLDLSPIIAYFILTVLRSIIINILMMLK
jgi:YggT family protein